jgi:hypothetical protein
MTIYSIMWSVFLCVAGPSPQPGTSPSSASSSSVPSSPAYLPSSVSPTAAAAGRPHPLHTREISFSTGTVKLVLNFSRDPCRCIHMLLYKQADSSRHPTHHPKQGYRFHGGAHPLSGLQVSSVTAPELAFRGSWHGHTLTSDIDCGPVVHAAALLYANLLTHAPFLAVRITGLNEHANYSPEAAVAAATSAVALEPPAGFLMNGVTSTSSNTTSLLTAARSASGALGLAGRAVSVAKGTPPPARSSGAGLSPGSPLTGMLHAVCGCSVFCGVSSIMLRVGLAPWCQ